MISKRLCNTFYNWVLMSFVIPSSRFLGPSKSIHSHWNFERFVNQKEPQTCTLSQQSTFHDFCGIDTFRVNHKCKIKGKWSIVWFVFTIKLQIFTCPPWQSYPWIKSTTTVQFTILKWRIAKLQTYTRKGLPTKLTCDSEEESHKSGSKSTTNT